jgi:hypothetical protein
VDIKPVREAFSTAYLAVLEAINEYLMGKGLTKKELPKSTDAYGKALQKHSRRSAVRHGLSTVRFIHFL